MSNHNKLIAEFLGYSPDKDGMYLMKDLVVDDVSDTYNFDQDNNRKGEVTIREGVVRTGFYPNQMEFNTNWNWLMYVVERIEEDIHISVHIEGAFISIKTDESGEEIEIINSQMSVSKLRNTYVAVTLFIEWNNAQIRLEHLRTELRAERISYGELMELQSLVEYIEESDVELLEAAGVKEKEA